MNLPTWLKPITVIAAGGLAAGAAAISAQCGGASFAQLASVFGMGVAGAIFHLFVPTGSK